MPNTELSRNAQSGFTYIGILIAVALAGIGLALTGELWSAAAVRDRERELLAVGDELRRAISSYYESTPGAAKQFPKSLDDLLRDRRYPVVRRHLRRPYPDPMTGSADWGIVPGPGGTIMGVFSHSSRAPIKRAGFPGQYRSFEKAETHGDWKFVYSGLRSGTAPGARPAGATSPLQTATPGAPGSAGGAAPATGFPRPPKKEEETDPHKKTCGVLATNDAIACAAATRIHGPAVGASCQATAQIRNAQCLAYGPLPILKIAP